MVPKIAPARIFESRTSTLEEGDVKWWKSFWGFGCCSVPESGCLPTCLSTLIRVLKLVLSKDDLGLSHMR